MSTCSRSLPLVLALSCALGAEALAQGRGGGTGYVVRAADADGNGSVSAAEWKQFRESLGAREGKLDRGRVHAVLLRSTFDKDSDGKLTGKDLEQLFQALDANGDGVVDAGERNPRPAAGRRRAGRRFRGSWFDGVVIAAADANGDGATSKAELTAYITKLATGKGGEITNEVVATWIEAGKATSAANRNAITPSVFLLGLDGQLDADKNGTLELADFDALFARLDANGDGQIAAAEARPRRQFQGGRGQRGRGGWRRPTAERRKLPPLMPWQRTLGDALALVKKTGKPLLICVNMDNETASESAAWYEYRDPEFVKLANGFIPVLASPDRHSHSDYDDRGRRIVDPKFGRLVDSEHIEIEPELYARYFNGRRVAPRHVGVDKDGKILFDIFMTGSFDPVHEALAKYGKFDAPPLPEPKTEREWLASPDAANRAALEARFLKVSGPDRARLAGLALSNERETQHPELVRLALRDPSRIVRDAGTAAALAHFSRVPANLLPEVVRACGTDTALGSELIDDLATASARAKDPTRKAMLDHLLAIRTGLETRSRLIDATTWKAALALAPNSHERPFASNEGELLDRRLDELERAKRDKPGDPRIYTLIAEATMRMARLNQSQGQNPTYLLEDVRAASETAAKLGRSNGKAIAYLAWASHLLNDRDAALRYATKALPLLIDEAGTPLAAKVLEVFVHHRTRMLYAAMNAKTPWPSSWITDTRAAFDVLLAHPACSEKLAREGLSFLQALGARAALDDYLFRCLAKWPASGELHKWLRAQIANYHGPSHVTEVYARIECPPELQPTIDWFEGLATVTAAEQQVQLKEAEAALATYRKGIACFRDSIQGNGGFARTANHYVGLALAGIARIELARNRLDQATDAIRESIRVGPQALDADAGLGSTPRKIAGEVIAALRSAGRQDVADELSQALGN